MIDADEVIREHVDRLGMEIWRLETDGEGRLISLCTAAVFLLFNQLKDLDKKTYEEYMNMVFEILREGAWFLWEKAHERRGYPPYVNT